MPTPYKLKLLNGILKLKTFSDQVLSIFGIKDLGTRTGNVTNGVVDWSIQHLTKTTVEWNADVTTILLDGQIGIENTGTTTYKFKIGNGVDLWSALGYAGGGSSSGVTSFNARTGVVVPANGDYTTAQLTISTDKNLVTDAELVVIGNTSGTNTGDNATNTTSNAYADGKVSQTITNGVTDKAPSEDVVFDALALKEIALNYGAASVNPVDATTYYFSYFLTAVSPSTTVTARPIKFTATRILTDVIFTEQHSVNGSGETCTLYLRNVTTSTDYLIGDFLLNGGSNTMVVNSYTGLSITVNSTDIWTWKMVMPTWATNPTALLLNLTAELR